MKLNRGAVPGLGRRPASRLPVAPVLAPILVATGIACHVGEAHGDPLATNPHGAARLLVATEDARGGTPLALALRLTLQPGWHTYWSNPGDAGMPPAVTVSVDGAAPHEASLGFPAPRRIDEGGLVGFGYTGEVTFPFAATPPSGDGAVRVAVHASFLVCANVCVPEEAALSLTLPRTTATPTPSPEAAAIAAARRALPRVIPLSATIASDGRLLVRGPAISPDTIAHATFFPDAPGLIDADATQAFSVDRSGLTLRLHPSSGFAHAGALSGVLSLLDRAGDETDLAVVAPKGRVAPTLPEGGPGTRSLVALALLGLLGGVVLNAMPCVLPVLAMKGIALSRAAASDRQGARRRSALLYAAGTIGSLVILGAVLLALRAAGSGVAWGFQFQSPPVVAGTALLLFAVGLNLLGVFEIGVAALAGVGAGRVARGGVTGELLAGALAVLVATPCTAPFMGAALAGALAGPPLAALVVFASLGLGLAAPMLLLGLVPGAFRLVPRPGAWMVGLRQILAFPMFASVVWLVWVVSVEAGPPGVLRAGAALLLLGFAAFASGLARPRLRVASAALAVLAAVAILPTIRAGAASPGAGIVAGAEPFSPSRLAALTASGRPVLVDISAAWCLTCLVNERIALAPARHALEEGGVVLMRGDWTRRDPAITAFLRRFGREGVPLAVFFAPDRTPLVLPQILTEGDVLDAIAPPRS